MKKITTPTKQQWRAILKEARRLQKKEKRIDLMLNDYLEEINPSGVPTYHDKGMVHGFMCAIKAIYGERVEDSVTYYLYEVPNIAKRAGKCEVRDSDGNTYNANNLGSYIQFLVKEVE